MAKKKKLTKAERKEARLRKGKQWLLTYTGSPKKMNKHYRERFHVDAVTAATVMIGGHESFLYNEDEKWFVEAKEPCL